MTPTQKQSELIAKINSVSPGLLPTDSLDTIADTLNKKCTTSGWTIFTEEHDDGNYSLAVVKTKAMGEMQQSVCYSCQAGTLVDVWLGVFSDVAGALVPPAK